MLLIHSVYAISSKLCKKFKTIQSAPAVVKDIFYSALEAKIFKFSFKFLSLALATKPSLQLFRGLHA